MMLHIQFLRTETPPWGVSSCRKSSRSVRDATRVVTKTEMARHNTITSEPSGEDQVLYLADETLLGTIELIGEDLWIAISLDEPISLAGSRL